MKISFITLLLISLTLGCKQGKNHSTESIDLETRMDSLVKTDMDSMRAAGIAVAVFKKDKPLLLKSYGYADLEWSVKMPVDASFEIGSVTKQFTGAAILLLAQQNKLNLDDEINRYITFNSQGKKVTIRHLLSHTSGIKGYTELPEFENFSKLKFPKDSLLRLVEKHPFDFDPGEALIYNNTGFFMLGLIIEKISGLSYEEYIKKNQFEPAGMSNSYYCSESKTIKNRAHGYDMGDKTLVRAGYLDHTWPYAAGSLCSTAEDLAAWNQALHHGKILNETSYAEFLKAAQLNDGSPTHYAKGITVTEFRGIPMISHGGGINGFLSENRYFPGEDLSIVVLVNTTGPVSPHYLADQLSNWLLKPADKSKNMFTGQMAGYLGKYKGRARGSDLTVTITKNDTTLLMQMGDNSPMPLKFHDGSDWTDGNTRYMFKGVDTSYSELRIDQTYGYYILKK
jgi:CubicO group peptidase (beta-lactamase class C family)